MYSQDMIASAVAAALAALDTASSQKQFARGRKAPGVTNTSQLMHGPGGLFSSMGGDQEVLSLRVTPRGIGQVMTAKPDIYANPEFTYITGFEESAGAEPSTECATCLSGEMAVCTQTAQYGYLCRETKTLDAAKVIERVNAGEVDVEILNDILGPADAWRPSVSFTNAQILQIATLLGMVETGVLMQNKLAKMIWQGNPANNVGTGYKEFPGLDILVGTGKYDAHTGTRCEALDSFVKDFGYSDIGAMAGTSFKIVRTLDSMMAYLNHVADRQNLNPVEWVIAMRPELWYELSYIWPWIQLATHQVTLPAQNSNMIDAGFVANQIDRMRSGMFITLNGRDYPVILDDGIFEYTNVNSANVPAGSYASNIYILPTKYLGGRDGLYFQHKDYKLTSPEYAEGKITDIWWTDNGRFQWTNERSKWCYTLSARVEPRVVLKVPQLAARLDHVRYTPSDHFKSPFEDDPYFTKGGVSTRTAPTLYSDWNAPISWVNNPIP